MAKEASIFDLEHNVLNSLYHLRKHEGKYFTASELVKKYNSVNAEKISLENKLNMLPDSSDANSIHIA